MGRNLSVTRSETREVRSLIVAADIHKRIKALAHNLELPIIDATDLVIRSGLIAFELKENTNDKNTRPSIRKTRNQTTLR